MQPPIPPPIPSPKPPPIPLAPGATPILPVGLHVKPDVVTIAYRDRFLGEWRNNLLFTLLHPVSLLMMVAAAAVFAVIYPTVFLFFKIQGFALRWIANLVFLILVNAILSANQIRNSHRSNRGESISLRPHELEYNSATKNRHVFWGKIVTIIDATGYFYFVRLDGVNYVPHAAFASPAARGLFLEAARTLQKSRGATWPAELVAQMAPTPT